MSNKEDYYQMLGLQNLRFRATQTDIKKAYRQCVLKYHPDKMAQNDNVSTRVLSAVGLRLSKPSKAKDMRHDVG